MDYPSNSLDEGDDRRDHSYDRGRGLRREREVSEASLTLVANMAPRSDTIAAHLQRRSAMATRFTGSPEVLALGAPPARCQRRGAAPPTFIACVRTRHFEQRLPGLRRVDEPILARARRLDCQVQDKFCFGNL